MHDFCFIIYALDSDKSLVKIQQSSAPELTQENSVKCSKTTESSQHKELPDNSAGIIIFF